MRHILGPCTNPLLSPVPRPRRDAAELLTGSTLYIAAEDRPDLEDEDEFYAQDLIGCQVFHT